MKKPFFLLGYKDDKYTLTSLPSLIALLVVSVFAFGLILAWPFVCIWSLNALFNLQIAYSLQTWLAAVILIVTIKGPIKFKKTKNEHYTS